MSSEVAVIDKIDKIIAVKKTCLLSLTAYNADKSTAAPMTFKNTMP